MLLILHLLGNDGYVLSERRIAVNVIYLHYHCKPMYSFFFAPLYTIPREITLTKNESEKEKSLHVQCFFFHAHTMPYTWNARTNMCTQGATRSLRLTLEYITYSFHSKMNVMPTYTIWYVFLLFKLSFACSFARHLTDFIFIIWSLYSRNHGLSIIHLYQWI